MNLYEFKLLFALSAASIELYVAIMPTLCQVILQLAIVHDGLCILETSLSSEWLLKLIETQTGRDIIDRELSRHRG